MNVPPSQLLYNRKIRGTLPTLPGKNQVLDRHQEAKENQELRKEKGNTYAYQRRRAKTSLLQVGDKVLVKQRKMNKFSTNFNTTPYTIVAVRGSRLTAENNGHSITRNASFFKKFNGNNQEDDVDMSYQANVSESNENNNGLKEQLLRRSTRPRTQTERYGAPIDSSLIS